jgi:putative ABC transport system permease protein
MFKQYRRFIKRSPVASTLAGAVLAIGFAGSVLAYTVMFALSSPRPDGLRPGQYATIAEQASTGGSQPISWKTLEHLRASAGWSDPALAAYAEPIHVKLLSGPSARVVSVAAVSRGFFGGFTDGLYAGRDFSSSWGGENDGRDLIISLRLAQSLFPAPVDALNRTVRLNGEVYRVLGVAPASFSGLWSTTDAWVPPDKLISLEFGAFAGKAHSLGAGDHPEAWQDTPFFYALAGSRTAPLNLLQNELEDLVRSPANSPLRLHVNDGLTDDPISDAKIRFWARLSFLLSVSLIFGAGLNYCGLLLAQAPRYVEEIRLKRVFGARALQIMLEAMYGPAITVILAFLAGSSAAVLALSILSNWGTRLLPTSGIPWHALSVVLLTELAIASLWGIFVALLPSIRLMQDRGAPRVGHTSTASKNVSLALNGILAIEIGSCILICLVAAMIVSAVHSASKSALGFDSSLLTVVETGPASKGAPVEFSTAGSGDFPLAAFTRLVIGDSWHLSRIKYMSAASCAPLGQRMRAVSIQRLDGDSRPRSVHFCGASEGFFRTTGTAIFEGKDFSTSQLTGDPSEAIVNRSLAQELWPGEVPLHHSIRVEEPAWELQFTAEVVGVAEDMRLAGLASSAAPTVFLPLKGNVFTLSFPLYFLARGATSPLSIEELVRQNAANSMPSLGVNNSYSVDTQLRQAFIEQKARAWFSSAGATLIAIVAYIGLYGVLVHSVNSRRKEMGIRLCFGATPGSLRKMVIRQSLQCSAVGIAISLLAWKPLAVLMAGSWLGKEELSWQSLVAIPGLCLVASVGVSLLPAAVAARVSPAELLKEQ